MSTAAESYNRILLTGAALTLAAAYCINRFTTPDRTMASRFRQLAALVLRNQVDVEKTTDSLRAADVPLSLADCRTCPDPCEEGWHEPYPRRFDIDTESQMLGSVAPYARTVVISTGTSDWDLFVTNTSGSLAAHLARASAQWFGGTLAFGGGGAAKAPGVFASAASSRVSILNGSHRSISESEDDACETVLVFPDYTMVSGVPRSRAGAEALWAHAVDPAVGRAGAGAGEKAAEADLKTYVLEYSCVILLCSHKKVDKRCAIAAPKLERAFTLALEAHHFEVHTNLAHPSAPPLDISDEEVQKRLREAQDEKRVLIVRNSHMGGHKYAGNAILCFPQGHNVWYGRITTHEVEAIVSQTIIGGRILPALLRGGANITRPGCATLLDW